MKALSRKEILKRALHWDGYLGTMVPVNGKEVEYAILETLLDIRDLLTKENK